jgi:hypothetical protein
VKGERKGLGTEGCQLTVLLMIICIQGLLMSDRQTVTLEILPSNGENTLGFLQHICLELLKDSFSC